MRYIAALILGFCLVTIPQAVAQAYENCVTWGEVDQLKVGMRMQRVHEITDTNGWIVHQSETGGVRYQHRYYTMCAPHGEWDDKLYIIYTNPLGDGETIWKAQNISTI